MPISENLITLSALAGSWFLVTGLIWKLFERVEKAATDEAKKVATSWILSFDPANNLSRLSEIFGNSFDSVFGTKHLSWKCFKRSSIASCLAALIFLSIWCFIRPSEAIQVVFGGELVIAIAGFFSWILLFNLVPDYISLLQTRLIVQKLKGGFSSKLLWLIVDLVLTLSISIVAWCGIILFSSSKGVDFERLYVVMLDIVIPLSNKDFDVLFPPGIVFYSTFLSSIWLWLYIISVFLIRISSSIDSTFNLIKKYLYRPEQPFTSLGAVSVLIITILYALVIPVYLVAM